VTRVEYFFDPGCPWTWLTSRWLVDAARNRDVEVVWRALSLKVLSEGESPAEYDDLTRNAFSALRLVAALEDAGRNDLIGEFYTAIGERVHDGGDQLTQELIRKVAEEVGAAGWLAAALDADDTEAAVRASTQEAMDLAGPGVGSPVLAWGEPKRGFHGPLVNPGPRGEAAGHLLDLVLGIGQYADFFELKRTRRDGAKLPAPGYQPPA
jgi:2-hydroxychromene-2-carboxylate isomerase